MDTKETKKSQIKAAIAVFFCLVMSAGFILAGVWLPIGHKPSGTPTLIAHAGGSIEHDDTEYLYSNSEEAFIKSCEMKLPYIEVDFVFSSDGELIGVHKWEALYFGKGYGDQNRMSYEEYKNHKLAGIFTGLTFDGMIALMRKYPDVAVVLDTKDTDYDAFFDYIAKKLNAQPDCTALTERIVPQLYDLEMYATAETHLAFPLYILTLYKYENAFFFPSADDIIKREKIKIVTTTQFRLTNVYATALRKANLQIWMHPIEKVKTVNSQMRRGVSGFYTHALTPKDL